MLTCTAFNLLTLTKTTAQNHSGHSVFVCESGELRSFGKNNSCQLASGSCCASEDEPQVVIGNINNAVSVAVGYSHSLALLDDGSVLAWGDNSKGETGQSPTSVSQECDPTEVALPGCAVAVAAGTSFSMALLADGTVWCWGYDYYGQLGDGVTGSPYYSYTPVQAGTFINAVAISAGASHALALLEDGTVLAWGAGSSGQVGNNGTSNEVLPVQVEVLGGSSLADVVAIDAGADHSLALQSDGDVFVWGNNINGQLGIGSSPSTSSYARKSTGFSSSSNIDIAAGSVHSMVLLSNGNTVVSGNNGEYQFGQTSPSQSYSAIAGPTLSNAVDIVVPSTAAHCWAIKSNGELWAWGNNTTGAVGIGSGSSNVGTPTQVNDAFSQNQCNAIPSEANHPQPCCVAVREDERIELGENGNETFTGGFSYSGQDMSIDNIITLQDGNYFLTDCDVICWKDAQIVVESTAKLYIRTNSHLYACGDMWDGILVEDSGRVFLYSGSIIEDAEVAFDVQENGYYYAVDATFNRNYIHIRHSAPTAAGNNPYRVLRSKFLCQESIIPFNTAHANLLPPRQTEYTWTQIEATNVDRLLVGSSGNGNVFDHAVFGILASGVKDVEVLYNDFDDVGYLGTYVINTPNVSGAQIDINYNTYDKSIYPIYCYDNDTTVRARITYNEIDFAGMGTPAPTGMRGITVSEITPPAGGDFNNHYDISDNLIENVATGIRLENLRGNNNGTQATLYIHNNHIKQLATASDQGAGIRMENVTESAIIGNEIHHPTNGINWHDHAIRVSGGNGNILYCNDLHHIGNGIWFDGYQTSGTEVANNDFNRIGAAFLLNWGDIGPQPLGSGGAYQPHDNEWTDPSWWDVASNRFTTNVLGTHTHTTEFRVRELPPSVYYPDENQWETNGMPVAVSVMGGTWQNGCVINGPSFKTDGSEGIAEQPDYVSVIEPSEPQSEREANQQWIGKYGLYDRLSGDEELLASANELESFFADNASSNMGRLHNAIDEFRVARAGQETSAAMQLQAVTPQNSVERTLMDLLTILYANATDLAALSDNETEQMREIARRCPLDDGFGVYMARAALLKVDTFPRNYANECELAQPLEGKRNKTETVSDDGRFSVYPNPSNGLLTIEYNLGEEENGHIEVFDLSGRKVFDSVLRSRNSTAQIRLEDLQPGLYLLRIAVNGNIELSERISVIK